MVMGKWLAADAVAREAQVRRLEDERAVAATAALAASVARLAKESTQQ